MTEKEDKRNSTARTAKGPNLFGLLTPYKGLVIVMLAFALITQGLGLIIPRIIARGIDSYTAGTFDLGWTAFEFFLTAFFVFLFAYLQNAAQTYAAERVAKDNRNRLIAKISRQTYSYIQRVTSSRLLTNLTSDTDNIKMFVAQAVINIISSIFVIIGASILLLVINWRLALIVLLIIPLMGGAFFFVFSKMRPLFGKTQAVVDKLNRVINESILGSSLVRVLNSQQPEYQKFVGANVQAKDLGLQIIGLFSSLIPIINFVSNLAILAILSVGGHYVIAGSITLGNFTAFTSYVSILFFPILIIGFSSNVIASASASLARLTGVLETEDEPETGTLKEKLRGDVEVEHVKLSLDGRPVLKDVSFTVKAGSKTAIIGPTAAGKTQLLYVMTGLLAADGGSVNYDGKPLADYDRGSFYQQVGFVFQDSVIFNMSLRENIAFNTSVTDADLRKAIDTAELGDFVDGLPRGLDTIASERGMSLSGGQKQRIMLARALALNPKILLLDDFTSRVDSSTERKIVANIERNYPHITLISVTQKISSVGNYEQIVLLMEGEVLAKGTHEELMRTSPEYVQIFDSQKSTNVYEAKE